MSNEADLKACPFCGPYGELQKWFDSWGTAFVDCNICGQSFLLSEFNRARPREAELEGLVERLTKKLRMGKELVAGEYHPSPLAIRGWIDGTVSLLAEIEGVEG